jgi:hypothetical protein
MDVMSNVTKNLDLFVVSASDPTVFLDYASISIMNSTLDTIWDPINLGTYIFIILDYLAVLHPIKIVNLDIKP